MHLPRCLTSLLSTPQWLSLVSRGSSAADRRNMISLKRIFSRVCLESLDRESVHWSVQTPPPLALYGYADSNVAPSLQAKEAELKRAQIGVSINTVRKMPRAMLFIRFAHQDKIDNMLQTRARQMSGEATPPQPDESPIDKSTTVTKLEKSLKQRPDETELKERNILKSMSTFNAEARSTRRTS